MIDAKAFPRQFFEQLLNRRALIKFLMARAPGRTVPGFFNDRRIAFLFARKAEIQIRIFLAERRQIFATEKVMDRFIVSRSDLYQMLREIMGGGMAMLQIHRKITALTAQAVGIFIQSLQQLENLA